MKTGNGERAELPSTEWQALKAASNREQNDGRWRWGIVLKSQTTLSRTDLILSGSGSGKRRRINHYRKLFFAIRPNVVERLIASSASNFPNQLDYNLIRFFGLALYIVASFLYAVTHNTSLRYGYISASAISAKSYGVGRRCRRYRLLLYSSIVYATSTFLFPLAKNE